MAVSKRLSSQHSSDLEETRLPVDIARRLTIELVPVTCWYSNVRSNVAAKTWDRLQEICFQRAKFRCEVCQSIGPHHPVECHEIWTYVDARLLQRLDGLIALCPKCHEVKHIGRALQKGRIQGCLQHLMAVNCITSMQAVEMIRDCTRVHTLRSAKDWRLDITLLSTSYGVRISTEGREIGLVHA